MIAVHLEWSGRALCVYVGDLRQCLDLCSACRRAGAKVVLIRAPSAVSPEVCRG